MYFKQLEEKVIQWGAEKGILTKATPITQFEKTQEEVDELKEAITTNNKPEIIDAIGDITVTLILQCELQGISFVECLHSAYNEIKDRKGKMVNGTFVKE